MTRSNYERMPWIYVLIQSQIINPYYFPQSLNTFHAPYKLPENYYFTASECGKSNYLTTKSFNIFFKLYHLFAL